ncbi:MAG TPA: LysE family transporter [Deltaproteobacteria bacterium]|nr:LysE family transporter [Deltaproteobacteria bacterium]HPJ94298.1 LysE family transporter [Deltaproteobacteria bacterium]HPR51393.1 LysE family transporter [Deltaproteobacteria bacterium]
MLAYLFSGTVFGLSAGLAPGPLLTLVITETLRGGLKAGIRVALAPLITDVPIVLLTLFVISKLTHFEEVLGLISIFGAVFVAYLGYESMCTKEIPVLAGDTDLQSLRKGVITNFLNPHPYLFWFSVGSPMAVKAYSTSVLSAVAFVCSFYVLLVGAKIILAVLISTSRSLLLGKAYQYTMKILGMLLLFFAGFLLWDGLGFLGLC